MKRKMVMFFSLILSGVFLYACERESEKIVYVTGLRIDDPGFQCEYGGKKYVILIGGVEQTNPPPEVVCNDAPAVTISAVYEKFAPECSNCHRRATKENIEGIHVMSAGSSSHNGATAPVSGSGCGVCHGGALSGIGFYNEGTAAAPSYVLFDNSTDTSKLLLSAGPTCYTCHYKPTGIDRKDGLSFIHANNQAVMNPGSCGTGAYNTYAADASSNKRNSASGAGAVPFACHDGYEGIAHDNQWTRQSWPTPRWRYSAHGYDDTFATGTVQKGTAIDTAHNNEACASCHTGAFYKEFSVKFASRVTSKLASFTGGVGAQYFASFEALVAERRQNMTDVEVAAIGCTACHNAHSTDLATTDYRLPADTVIKSTKGADITVPAGEVLYSAEYLLCTSCHAAAVKPVVLDVQAAARKDWDTTTKYFEYVLDEAVQAGTDRPQHDERPNRSIADTHFAGKYKDAGGNDASPVAVYEPASLAGGYVTLKGYGVNAASATACTDCHDAHSTSKMGFYNKHTTAAQPFAGFNYTSTDNEDAYNMYRLAVEAKEAGHSGLSERSAGFARKGSFSASCAKCHNPARTRNAVQIGGNDSPAPFTGTILKGQKGLVETAMPNEAWGSLGCNTCHDMTMSQDNGTGALRPRVTGVYGTEAVAGTGGNGVPVGITEGGAASVVDLNLGWYLTAGSAVTAPVMPGATANRSLNAYNNLYTQISDNTTKDYAMGSSLTCISCHVGRAAPILIGQDNSTGAGSKIVSVSANHGYPAATNVLGLYYTNWQSYTAGTYAEAGTHSGINTNVTNSVDTNPRSCISCHGVYRETHIFSALGEDDGREARIMGKTSLCGNQGCHQGWIGRGQYRQAKANRAGVTAYRKIFAHYSGLAPVAATDGATATAGQIDLAGARANYSVTGGDGAAVHGGKLLRQVSWDSLEVVMTAANGGTAVTVGSLYASKPPAGGFTAADVNALKAWLGSTRP